MTALVTDPSIRRALEYAAALGCDQAGISGFGVAVVRSDRGRIKDLTPFVNKITTAGDQYYAQKVIVGIFPGGASAPTAVTGMKLGTATTAAAKSGTGAAGISSGSYLSGSNATFASGYPTAAAVPGTDLGWVVTYQCQWPAGTGTLASSTINEAAIVNDAATNATALAANTISRAVFASTQAKTTSDSLTVTWLHTFLGA